MIRPSMILPLEPTLDRDTANLLADSSRDMEEFGWRVMDALGMLPDALADLDA